jgi:hypothetical protein
MNAVGTYKSRLVGTGNPEVIPPGHIVGVLGHVPVTGQRGVHVACIARAS